MTTTTQLITMLTIMLAINISMVSFESAILDVNPSSTAFDNWDKTNNNPYGNYASDTTLLVGTELLPDNPETEGDTTGNIFTDTWNSFKSWTEEKLAPLGFIPNTLTQPYGLLKTAGLSPMICLAFATMWYLIGLLLFVSWLGGR